MQDDIKQALEVLRSGGTILYPTDTIWGIGCDATHTGAVENIFRIKQRPDTKSMIVLLGSQHLLSRYVNEVPEIAWQLMEVSDRPLTLIFDGARNLAENLVAEDGSIGIRIPDDPFCQQLLQRFKKPIVSTSANISGSPAPANFSEISEEIKSSVDYIVNRRQDDFRKNSPSSVIKIGKDGVIKILRN
jgi:L-threonylcarbamoyladenylate synthase